MKKLIIIIIAITKMNVRGAKCFDLNIYQKVKSRHNINAFFRTVGTPAEQGRTDLACWCLEYPLLLSSTDLGDTVHSPSPNRIRGWCLRQDPSNYQRGGTWPAVDSWKRWTELYTLRDLNPTLNVNQRLATRLGEALLSRGCGRATAIQRGDLGTSGKNCYRICEHRGRPWSSPRIVVNGE